MWLQIFPAETLMIIFPVNVIEQMFAIQNLVFPQTLIQNYSAVLDVRDINL